MARSPRSIRAVTSVSPNVSAQRHLRRYLDRLATIARSQATVPFSGSVEDRHYYDDPHVNYRDQNTLRIFDADQFSYEANADPSDEALEIAQIHESAITQLNEGNAEDLIATVHQLIEFIRNTEIDFGEMERWFDLLQPPEPLVQRLLPPTRERVFEIVSTAIKRLSVELIKLIARDRRALDAIEWRHLELVVATALEGLGFDVELTPPSKDGGKDVIATCSLNGKEERFYIELKHWRSGKRPGWREVSDFIEVNLIDATSGGVFISTSGYSSSICSCFTELGRTNIDLGDSGKIEFYCSQYVKGASGLWEPSTELSSLLYTASVLPFEDGS